MKPIYPISFFFLNLLLGCSQVEEKPNVIIILADQWRAAALGYAGNDQVITPALDAFAGEAINFKNTVSVTPVCTPFRASLLTGKYPSTNGMFLNDIYLPAEELTMAEIYQSAGYQTAYFGKWHLDGHGRKKFVAPERRQGFEYWKASECDHSHLNEHYYLNNDTTIRYWDGYSPFAIAESVDDYLGSAKESEKPFLLFVSLTTPHFPHHTALPEYLERYPEGSLSLPDNVPDDMKELALKELRGYYAHCTATDKAIGDIIQSTKDLDIFDDSIILFTSDHGEMMGAHGYKPFMKHQPHAESANIPMLLSYPGMKVKKGSALEIPVTTPDVLPTLLSLSGIGIPEGVEGDDLSSVIKGRKESVDRAALYMNLVPFGTAYPDDEYRAIKTSRYTYVKTPDGPSMLFDDQQDPLQMDNLVGKPRYMDIQNELDGKLMTELRKIGEEEIKPRTYYTEKFGFEGRPERRKDYVMKDYFNVEVAISPKVER